MSINKFTDVWFDLYTGQQTMEDDGTQRIIILTKESFRITNPDKCKRIQPSTSVELIQQLELAINNSNNKLELWNL